MSLFLAELEIPTEVISVHFLLLISLANWIKNRYDKKRQEGLEEEEEDPMREIIWRRQMGELEETQEYRGGPPPMPSSTIRVDRRTPVLVTTPAPVAPPPIKATVVSAKEAALAATFEQSIGRKVRRRTNHRSQIDKLLRSPYAAKNAILLTEILGPPVSLRTGSDH